MPDITVFQFTCPGRQGSLSSNSENHFEKHLPKKSALFETYTKPVILLKSQKAKI